MPISQSFLLGKAFSFQVPLYENVRKAASAGHTKSAFLCHSHKDEALVKGLIALFQEVKIDLYIDWKDNAMPDSPNMLTAIRIQSKIRTCNYFFFLASQDSMTSRWCPWEIGYADSSNKSIYIIPTNDTLGIYGNEYLQLYRNIDIGTIGQLERLSIFEAGSDSGKALTLEALK